MRRTPAPSVDAAGRARAVAVAVAIGAGLVAFAGVAGVAGVEDSAVAGTAHHHTRRARGLHARSRFEAPHDAAATPAFRYGTMTPLACEQELDARGVPFVRETARGVHAPVRLTGPLHGVTFRAEVADADRETTPYEVADCSLVLALDDLAKLLAAHDVVEVVHYSMWRPPEASWPDDKIATRHAVAVAIDAASFVKADGTTLEVLRDFHGAIGAPTCGAGARPHPATPAAVELRAILCEAVAAHLFNVVLTPDFNRPHRNHFHLEVTSGVTWFLVH